MGLRQGRWWYPVVAAVLALAAAPQPIAGATAELTMTAPGR
jgi:hypothetical protein